MHCAICDKNDDNVTHETKDCPECQAIIYDTLMGYDQETELLNEE